MQKVDRKKKHLLSFHQSINHASTIDWQKAICDLLDDFSESLF
jgi:hypothetical protein